ncbi:serine protease inhibitor 77Ba-like [Galleria mellonella]|uniref:Serine protease inhibitor 77Ba-like n=1 Tax=Galleria mellonella TaxID=7137 RepID=A0A6J1W7J6_GALME|nr:serine protease inhibitor 77Ba-like [Galleria mellonella]
MWKIFSVMFIGLATTAPVTYKVTDLIDVLISPINKFSIELLNSTYNYQRSNLKLKNVVIAPFSIWNVFSLLAEGASGKSFLELSKALRLSSERRSIQRQHRFARNFLRSRDENVVINAQTIMLYDKNFSVCPQFAQSTVNRDTDIFPVDTRNPTKLAKEINDFISRATNGKIGNAVKPDILENLKMIIIDALYFNSDWTVQFDVDKTRTRPFYNYNGDEIGFVNMMTQKAIYNIKDVPAIEANVLELTYGKNKQFSMLIVLPFKGISIDKLLRNMASCSSNWMNSMSFESVQMQCSIPRFKLTSQTDVIPALQSMGIMSIFDKQQARLEGVSNISLFVSQTVQNIEMDVTETGTTVASSTMVGLETKKLEMFIADREFVFLIKERRSNLILFAGVYEDPSSS